jgi:hypothetical protein
MSIEITPEAEAAFQHWYQTEGVRTPSPSGEHWHEAYQRMAFFGGINYANINSMMIDLDITDLDDELDDLEDKVKAISKLMKVLIRQNRK